MPEEPKKVKTKLNSKNSALVALILGTITASFGIILFGILETLHCMLRLSSPPLWVKVLLYFLVPVFGLIVVILGIRGMDSSKRGTALLGIMLGILSISIPIYYLFF